MTRNQRRLFVKKGAELRGRKLAVSFHVAGTSGPMTWHAKALQSSRRLDARWAVVNAGIGGNQVIGPAEYSPQKPFPGGPAAVQRLERNVLSLSGVKAVIWLEGTNDFIRTSGVFDGVADFDRATTDPQTGGMQAAFIPDNTVGGPGDKLHPNRMGYQAMGMGIDLGLFGVSGK